MDQQAESSRLSSRKRKELKGRAHSLDPVARVGKDGLTEAVLQEIRRDLDDHELIKIKVRCEDQKEMKAVTEQVTSQTSAQLIQTIGHMIVMYRESKEDPKIQVPQ